MPNTAPTPKTVPMTVQDALWLTMDRPNNLMVVDGAMVLETAPTMAELLEVYAGMVRRFPVFHRRAVPSGIGWAWQDDPDFDLARHVHAVTLPGKADMAALQAFFASKRTDPLPKDRPLWLVYLVEPLYLPDGSTGAAIVNRFHHSIADGVRLVQLMLGLCDEPESSAAPVTVARKGVAPSAGPGGLRGLAESTLGTAQSMARMATDTASQAAARALQAATHPLDTVSALPRRVLDAPGQVVHGVEDGFQLLRHPDHLLDALEVLGVESTRGLNDLSSLTKITFTGNDGTVWTGKPGTMKSVAWSEPIPLAEVKDIGRATGTTVNDVLISAVATALTTWLEDHEALIDEVNWMVPVNLKPFADNLPEDLGNYFALVFLPMPLGKMPTRERLETMHHRMDRIKHSDEAVLTFGLQRIVSQSPHQIAFFLTNFFANKAVGVLTNVPGPATQLTFSGHPVRQVIGFAPCSGDQPMTATIFSYNGEVTVGFASDDALMPEPGRLAQLVVDELDAMFDELVESN